MNFFKDSIAFTLDIDWASDEICQYAIDVFERNKIKCTIFATHKTTVLNNLNSDIFEVGIHPNFNPLLRSNPNAQPVEKVLDDLLNYFPGAQGVRCHSLVQSGYLYEDFKKMGLKYASNQYLAYWDNIKPYELWNGMFEIPFNWADDGHCDYGYDFLSSKISLKSPLNIYCFHPIHIFLNTNNLSFYQKIGGYHNNFEYLKKNINLTSDGTYNFLLSLINNVVDKRSIDFKMSEILEKFKYA